MGKLRSRLKCYRIILDSKVIFKSILNPDDNLCMISSAQGLMMINDLLLWYIAACSPLARGGGGGGTWVFRGVHTFVIKIKKYP